MDKVLSNVQSFASTISFLLFVPLVFASLYWVPAIADLIGQLRNSVLHVLEELVVA